MPRMRSRRDCRLSTICVGSRAMLRSEPSRSMPDAAARVAGRAAQPAAGAGVELLRVRLRPRGGLAGLGAVRGRDRGARRRPTIAFGSGMAAIAAVLETLPAGAKVVGPAAGYAWTRSLLAASRGCGPDPTGRRRIRPTPPATLAACEGAALLYVETPSNPLVEIAELDALCAGAHGAPVAVDGTFAIAAAAARAELGADFAIQSATKFIGGHSDLLLGVVTHARRTLKRCTTSARSSARCRVRSRRTSRCAACARCRCGSQSPSATRRHSPSVWPSGIACTTPGCRTTRATSAPRGSWTAMARCSPSSTPTPTRCVARVPRHHPREEPRRRRVPHRAPRTRPAPAQRRLRARRRPLGRPGAGAVRAGVDIGGTFTDLCIAGPDGIVRSARRSARRPRPRTASRPCCVTRSSARPALSQVVHATTLVTNALIERKGAKVALLATAGFRDVMELARERRPDIYRLDVWRPEPLVPRHLRFDVNERTLADGEIEQPVDEARGRGARRRARGARDRGDRDLLPAQLH